MELSNINQLINNASANDNGVLFCSSPDLLDPDCTSLETFDFESFLTAPDGDLSIPCDYAALKDIDFAAEAHTSVDGGNCANLLPPENPGSPEPLQHSPLTCPPIAVDTFSLPTHITPRDILITYPLYPNVYMTPQQQDQIDWQYTEPHRLEDQHNNFEQNKSPRQVLEATSNREKEPAQPLSLPPRIPKATRKSRRTLNISKFDPSLYYKPLAEPPKSWKPSSFTDTTFTYNAEGELDPQSAFSREQISDYLTSHPLHRLYGPSPPTKHSGLKLLVQTIPADAGNRYPTGLSSKCRFACCPVPHRTIRNGQFRVAFDELSVFGQPLDPFHNAGYVHLFCLEKNFDFPLMCRGFNVQGDDREFPEGRNRMAITRDYPAMLEIVNNFIQTSVPFGGNKPANWYDQSLSLALTRYHLEHQCQQRQRVREARDGNSIDRHLNNLDVMVERGKAIRRRKNEENMHGESRKRTAGDLEDCGLDENAKRAKTI